MADRPVLSNPNPFWTVLCTYITAALRLHKISCLAEQSQGCNYHVCVATGRMDRCIYLFIYNVGESSCNFGDGTDQRVQFFMFMMMIYLFICALTHFAVSILDNRMISEYEFGSFNKIVLRV